MTLAKVRTILHRRAGLVLLVAVVLLGTVVAALAVNLAGEVRDLSARTAPDSSSSPQPAPSEGAPSHHHHEHSVAPDPTIPTRPATTPVPTAAPPAPLAPRDPSMDWTLAATFDNADDPLAVMDIGTWSGRFVAVGTSWVGGTMAPRLWVSDEGHAWAEIPVDLGPGISLQTVAALPDGRLMVLGTVGGRVEFWSDPERAAAWVSHDGSSWTAVELPFGAVAVEAPVRFAAGARGIVATTGKEIWYSTDGVEWVRSHVATRGTLVYGPIAGDDGWIVERANASHGTTTLLVSGDAATWHEVDLGNVGTVASVSGDWLASRRTDDWSRTEIIHSTDGLAWSHSLWLDEMAPPDGSDGTLDPAALGGATLTGTDDVLVMSPWRGGHCSWMPGGGWGAWLSTDPGVWSAAGLGGDAVVTHAAELGDVTILAGYGADTGDVSFWVNGG